jgi:hypothetical protein
VEAVIQELLLLMASFIFLAEEEMANLEEETKLKALQHIEQNLKM